MGFIKPLFPPLGPMLLIRTPRFPPFLPILCVVLVRWANDISGKSNSGVELLLQSFFFFIKDAIIECPWSVVGYPLLSPHTQLANPDED